MQDHALPLIHNRTARDRATELVEAGKPFSNSSRSISGEPGAALTPGRLADRTMVAEVYRATYVIYSYKTPIAWLRADGTWTHPDLWYSATTARHHGIVSYILSGLDCVVAR